MDTRFITEYDDRFVYEYLEYGYYDDDGVWRPVGRELLRKRLR